MNPHYNNTFRPCSDKKIIAKFAISCSFMKKETVTISYEEKESGYENAEA